MRVKRLDEILEECITAGIEGRRTVEQSLALYPAAAGELEPLLRTALDYSYSYQSYVPPAAVAQRGLNRFLADASARKNFRHLAADIRTPGRFAGFRRTPMFGGFAAAAAVLVVTVAVAGGGMFSGGDSGGGESVTNSTDTSPFVTGLFDETARIRDMSSSAGSVSGDDFATLAALLAALRATPPEDIQATDELKAAIADTYGLLTASSEANPDLLNDPVIQDAIEDTRNIAGTYKVPLPSPILADKTPGSTPPAATDAPTPAPTDVATPAPTDGPTAAPTEPPAPTPEATADNRFPGLLPGN